MISFEIDDDEYFEILHKQKYKLLLSGYQSPQLNQILRCPWYMSSYERQIIRSLLSSNIQRIPFENSNLYLVNYDSELTIFNIQAEQIKTQIQTKAFASFVKINSSSKHPKRIKSYMIDRNNIIYLYEMDFMKDEHPFFRQEELEINKTLRLANYIFLSCVVSQDGHLLVMVSDSKIFFLDLLEKSTIIVNNSLKMKQFPYQLNLDSKVHLDLSQCKKSFIVAHESLVFIYTNFQLKKQFELKNKQKILNIKLFHDQLIILTNKAIIKIDNISNEYIELKDEDYFYPLIKPEGYLKFGTFEIENQEIKSVIIQDSYQQLYLIEMQSIQQGQMKIKEIKAQFQEDDKIEMIEMERKTMQSMVLRIFFFNKNHELGFLQYQGNLDSH